MGILNLTLTLIPSPSPIINPKYMDVHLDGGTIEWEY